MHRFVLLPIVALGCASAFTPDDSTDTTTGAFDAGPRERDLGPSPVDAFRGLPDRPPIGGDSALRDELACNLSEGRAQRAVLVHVACVDDGSTVPGLIEAWHAGLLGAFQQGVDGWTGFPLSQGCAYWQCLSAAASCEEREACFESSRVPASCTPRQRFCDPDRGLLLECNDEGTAYVQRFDCAAIGGSCPEDRCQFPDGCTLGEFGEELRCQDGDVVASCSEAIRIDCAAVEPGTTCTSFAIGGELPTYYCGPESIGGFTAGAYATPVECTFPGGTIAFTNQATQQDIRISCPAEGFADCNERGCTF